MVIFHQKPKRKPSFLLSTDQKERDAQGKVRQKPDTPGSWSVHFFLTGSQTQNLIRTIIIHFLMCQVPKSPQLVAYMEAVLRACQPHTIHPIEMLENFDVNVHRDFEHAHVSLSRVHYLQQYQLDGFVNQSVISCKKLPRYRKKSILRMHELPM